MDRLREIHPSATLFAAILLALFLPFGQAVESCGSSRADFSVADVLTGTVEPIADGRALSPHGTVTPDQRFADDVERAAWPFAAFLAGLAVIGVLLATFFRGALWGTCSLLIALDTAVLALAVNLGDMHAGGHIAFWGSSLGAFVALALALMRWRDRRSLARSDTTPHASTVR